MKRCAVGWFCCLQKITGKLECQINKFAISSISDWPNKRYESLGILTLALMLVLTCLWKGESVILAAVPGWFIVNWLNAERDRSNKKRDTITQYLLEAYRQLESASNREQKTTEQSAGVESAVADIQLLGTPEQVLAVTEFARAQARHGQADLTGVLRILRRDLRKELGLAPAEEEFMSFRWANKDAITRTPTSKEALIISEQLRARDRAECEQIGIQRGREEVAVNLLQLGVDMDTIVKSSGLPRSVVEGLASRQKTGKHTSQTG